MVWHLIPVRDTEEHIEVVQCPCNPQVLTTLDTNESVVVHNLFDGREGLEIVKQLFSRSSSFKTHTELITDEQKERLDLLRS